MQTYKLSELVAKFGGILVGDDISVSGIAPTNLANGTQITFLTDNKYKKKLAECQAGAIITRENDGSDVSMPKIITTNPYHYFSLVSGLFNPRRQQSAGIAASAIIDPSTIIANNPAIAPNVVIGANSSIGANCQIFPNVVIGEHVHIGENITIYPNVTIYDKVTIGNNCVFHSGCAIGSDGFGNAQDSQRHYVRIPQIGGVIIGNDVEIGANSTIDCGTFEPTILADGVRIDNLVQIAHNVEIGAHTGIAACSGVAGNTKIGNYVLIGGGVGITGHITIADNVVIGAKSGVSKSILKSGLYSSTLVAEEYNEWAKTVVHIRNLDSLNKKVKDLQQKLQQLEELSKNE